MGKLLWSAIVMVLLVSGCGWNGTPTREDDITPLTSIVISQDYSTIAKGTSTKLKANGYYSGQSKPLDITSKVTWTVDSTGVAKFSTVVLNRVIGITDGSAVVTATFGNIKADYTLTVRPATISSITVTPSAPSVANGLTQQFTAIGTFTDDITQNITTQDITLDATWSPTASDSTTTDYATVSNDESSKGLATANAKGSSAIIASFGNVSGTTDVTVTDPVVTSIAVTPANPSALSLSTKQFTAMGTYSDKSTANITSQVTWSSSNTSYATIGSGGMATALVQGAATITAKLDSVNVSGSTGLTVTGGNLSNIAITPSAPTLVKDTKTLLTAMGTFTNGGISISRDITGVVVWSSDNAAATLTSGSGNLEWLNAVSAGTATITAKAPTGKTGTAALTVTAPTLSSLAMSSSTLALTFDTVATTGTGGQLKATAAYPTSPTSTDVTYSDGCSWSSDKESVATVGNVGLTKGLVTAVGAGKATITATFGSPSVSVISEVTVTARTLKSLAITGLSSVTAGNQTSYAAKAVYTDSSTEYDVTDKTTWSIQPENVSVAVLADSINQPGQVVAVGNGAATLSAAFGGMTATKTITVP